MVAFVIALMENHKHSLAVKTSLEDAGHAVSLVDCFTKAKDLLEKDKCDLIISDVHLENGGTVFDFLKWVKDDERLARIPFVLLSVQPTEMAKYLADGLRLTARALGAAKYISMETFDAALLRQELAEFLPKIEVKEVSQLTKEKGD